MARTCTKRHAILRHPDLRKRHTPPVSIKFRRFQRGLTHSLCAQDLKSAIMISDCACTGTSSAGLYRSRNEDAFCSTDLWNTVLRTIRPKELLHPSFDPLVPLEVEVTEPRASGASTQDHEVHDKESSSTGSTSTSSMGTLSSSSTPVVSDIQLRQVTPSLALLEVDSCEGAILRGPSHDVVVNRRSLVVPDDLLDWTQQALRQVVTTDIFTTRTPNVTSYTQSGHNLCPPLQSGPIHLRTIDYVMRVNRGWGNGYSSCSDVEDEQDTFCGPTLPDSPEFQFGSTPTDIIDLCASFIKMKVEDEEQGSLAMMKNLCFSAFRTPGHEANTKDDDLTSLFEDTEFDEDTLGGISEALTSSDTDSEVRRVQVKRRLSLSEPEYNADSESSHDYFRIADASTGSVSEDEDEHLSCGDYAVGYDTAALGAESARNRLQPSSPFRNFSNTLISDSLPRPHLASSSAPLLPGPTFPIASLVGIRSHHCAHQCGLSLISPSAPTISSTSTSPTSPRLDID